MTKKERTPRDGAADERRRKHRPRPVPRWLMKTEELDAIARSRCLMVLSVLSGEKPVTDAILEAKISRGTYYQMETRALNAMLAALNPLASAKDDGSADLSAAAARIEELQAKAQRLERDKRRTERLLLLTRKTLRSPLTVRRRGRPPKSALPGSIPSGRPRSGRATLKSSPSAASTPTKAGESATP
jgi:hypothetical protein